MENITTNENIFSPSIVEADSRAINQEQPQPGQNSRFAWNEDDIELVSEDHNES